MLSTMGSICCSCCQQWAVSAVHAVNNGQHPTSSSLSMRGVTLAESEASLMRTRWQRSVGLSMLVVRDRDRGFPSEGSAVPPSLYAAGPCSIELQHNTPHACTCYAMRVNAYCCLNISWLAGSFITLKQWSNELNEQMHVMRLFRTLREPCDGKCMIVQKFDVQD